MEHVVIQNNSGESIKVGKKNEHHIITIPFKMKRNSQYAKGTIEVVNLKTSVEVYPYSVGSDLGVTFSGFISGNGLFITLTTDNSGENLHFYYEA